MKLFKLTKHDIKLAGELNQEEIASMRIIAEMSPWGCHGSSNEHCPAEKMRKVAVGKAINVTYVYEDGRSCPAYDIVCYTKSILNYLDGGKDEIEVPTP